MSGAPDIKSEGDVKIEAKQNVETGNISAKGNIEIFAGDKYDPKVANILSILKR